MPGKLTLSPTLVQTSSLRFMSRHKWQSWLTFAGIVLGVTMLVAVDLANSSARRAFALSLQTVTGDITHQLVGGPNGIDEAYYVALRRELRIRTSAPMVTGAVRIERQQYTLIGTDPLSEAVIARHTDGLDRRGLAGVLLSTNAVIISQRTADNLKLVTGEQFEVEINGSEQILKVAVIFESENPAASESLIFTDISIAQRLFRKWGKLDRIDLVLSDNEKERLVSWLPAGLKLVESEQRNQSLQQMSEAFHINLTAMSLLAMLVAALLIYNTMTLSVLQRRHTLGIYRALGVSRREIFTLILSEAAIVAVAASLTGLVSGLLLGQFLVQLVTRTINDLYFNLHVSAFLIDPMSLLKGFSLGVGMTLVSAMLPAWEANRTEPVGVQQRSLLEQRMYLRIPLFVIAGVSLLFLGFIFVNFDQGSLIEGFISLTMMVLGFCLIVPSLVIGLSHLALVILSPTRFYVARMAVRGISAGISRTGLAIAALTVAVSVTVGVGIMVNSFRYTVAVWLEQSLDGDIYISPSTRDASQTIDELESTLREIEGVDAVATTRLVRVESEFGPIRIMAMSQNGINARMPVIESADDADTLFSAGQGIMISEPLSYHQSLNIDDSITLHTQTGDQQFRILGIFYDYTSSQGLIAMQRDLYRRWWQDDGITNLTVYKSSEADQQRLLKEIRKISSGLRTVSNLEIRQIAMDVFDRTFLITDVMRLLAVVVAFIGILSAMIALQLGKVKEFGVLRATGMTPGQIRAMIVGQTIIMGTFAGLLSIPLGLLMADILIEVINRRAFGWSMQHQVPVGVVVQAMILALVSATLAGLYPAREAALISPSEALREE